VAIVLAEGLAVLESDPQALPLDADPDPRVSRQERRVKPEHGRDGLDAVTGTGEDPMQAGGRAPPPPPPPPCGAGPPPRPAPPPGPARGVMRDGTRGGPGRGTPRHTWPSGVRESRPGGTGGSRGRG